MDLRKRDLSNVRSCRHRLFTNKRIGGIFNDMKTRCYNPSSTSYKFYGHKGVKICDEWLLRPDKFEQWALSNGYNPTLTIDRINADGDYSPENCRWVSFSENCKYKSTTNLITVNEITKTGRGWAEYLDLGVNTINKYLRNKGLDFTRQFIESRINKPVD